MELSLETARALGFITDLPVRGPHIALPDTHGPGFAILLRHFDGGWGSDCGYLLDSQRELAVKDMRRAIRRLQPPERAKALSYLRACGVYPLGADWPGPTYVHDDGAGERPPGKREYPGLPDGAYALRGMDASWTPWDQAGCVAKSLLQWGGTTLCPLYDALTGAQVRVDPRYAGKTYRDGRWRNE